MKKNAKKKWEKPRVEEVRLYPQISSGCDKTSARRREEGGLLTVI